MATTLGGGAEKVKAGPGTRASVAVAENLKGSALGASVAVAENLKGSALAGGAATRGCAKLYIRGEGPRPRWSGPCAGALVNEKSGAAPRSRIEPAQLGASVAASAWARGLLKLKMRGDGAARCTTGGGEAVSLAWARGLLKLKMRGDGAARCTTGGGEAVSLAWARGLLKLKMRGDGAARCTTGGGEAVSLAWARGLLKLKMRGDRAACGTDREAVSLGVVAVLVVAVLAECLARLGGGEAARTRSRTAVESDCRSHASITAQIWFQ